MDYQEEIEALLEIENTILSLNLEDGTIDFDSYYKQESKSGDADIVVLHSTYQDQIEDHILELSEFLSDETICRALLSHVVLQPKALRELCDRYIRYYPNLTSYTKNDKQAYENMHTLQILLNIHTTTLKQLRIDISNYYSIEDGFNFSYTVWDIIKNAEDEEDLFYKCIVESRKARKILELL